MWGVFNASSWSCFGGLRVTYNDGGVGFIGEISQATIKGGDI
jgi:hypothetical protein